MAAADYQHFTDARPETVFAALIRALPPLNGRVHSVEGFGTCVCSRWWPTHPRTPAGCGPRWPRPAWGRWCRSPAAGPPHASADHDGHLPLKALDRLFVEVDRKSASP